MSTIIPEEYIDAFKDLLNKLEKDTNNMFQITINKFDSDQSEKNCVIGDFETRIKKIEIYEIMPEYSELIGQYNSRCDVEEKIKKLRCDESFSETKIHNDGEYGEVIIGKCRKCNSYAGKRKRMYNHIRMDICQNCSANLRNKWHEITISKWDYKIYTRGGRVGSYSIINPIGKYRFID